MVNNLAYIVLLMIIGTLLYVRKTIVPKQKKYVSRLICFCLIVFSGFRFCVGTDFEGYSDMFYRILAEGRYYDIEWGYYWLVRFVNAIGGTAQLVFFIFSFITLYFIYKFIEYFSEDVELSWLVFVCIGPYFLSTFNGMRQWLVVAIFAYSLRFVKETNFKKYFFLNILGCLFHYSAILLIPLYWLLKAKNFSLAKIGICYLIFQISSMVGLLDLIADKLHATSYLEGDAMMQLDWSYYVFFALAVCFVIISIVYPDITGEDKIFKNMNALSGLTVFLALTASGLSNMIFIRYNLYFFVGYIILIPLVIAKMKDSSLRRLMTFVIIGFSTMYFFYVTSTATDLTPYQMNFDLFTWLGGN